MSYEYKIIYKYVVPVDGLTVELVNPKVVMVGTQPHESALPIMWIESDVSGLYDSKPVTYCFYGTGQHIPTDYIHEGSCSTSNGIYIWHIYRKNTESHDNTNKEE
jgi:hypothetical protein